jgi:hypothetical protein
MNVDGGSVNAFLAAALAHVMCVAGPIPALASVSVLQSVPVGGSVVGVVGPLQTFGELNNLINTLKLKNMNAKICWLKKMFTGVSPSFDTHTRTHMQSWIHWLDKLVV